MSAKQDRTSPCDTIISYTHTITHAYNTINTVYSIPSPLERALLSIKLDIKIKVLDQKKSHNSSINRLGLLWTRNDLRGGV